MPERAFSDEQLRAAIESLAEPDRFHAAERRVAAIAPQLQKLLAGALADGGWFDEAHSEQLVKLATIGDDEQRLVALRTLLAEEARLGMLVGVAVGWELSRELEQPGTEKQ